MSKDLYEKWKKHVQEQLHDLTKMKAKKVDAKCPKCLTKALEFDPSTGKVHCKRCGYEDYIAKVMK